MRRTMLVALAAVTALAIPANAGAAKKKKHHHAAPAAIKTGTYKAKAGTTAFNITLAKAKCTTTPGQGASATHLCVSLPTAPEIECRVPVNVRSSVGNYATPVALSSAGTATEKMAVTGPSPVPGAPPSPGTSGFAVTFAKNGTATGYLELNLTVTFGTATVTCASGKVPFTAKLG
jgi:hypothetical protein